MQVQHLGSRAGRVLRFALFAALFVVVLAGSLMSAGPGQLWAAENSAENPAENPAENLANGTVPPLARFRYSASPGPVQLGEVVAFTVTVVSTDTQYVDVTLGLTSTLPSGVAVLPNTVQATLGAARATASGQVTWTGTVEQPATIRITYQARVNGAVCGLQASRAVLYEIARVGGSPSPNQLTAQAQFTVAVACSVYLPRIALALTPLPALQNGDFEAGAAAGWSQVEGDKPRTLIYSTAQKPLPMNHGGQWFGWLGGAPGKISELRQKFVLPLDHTGIELRFLYRIESSDECGVDNDNGYVLLNGFLIGSPFRLCSQNATSSWQAAAITVPGTFWGREVTLALRSVTNAAKNSNWYVDNVEFCSTDPRASQPGPCQKQ